MQINSHYIQHLTVRRLNQSCPKAEIPDCAGRKERLSHSKFKYSSYLLIQTSNFLCSRFNVQYMIRLMKSSTTELGYKVNRDSKDEVLARLLTYQSSLVSRIFD